MTLLAKIDSIEVPSLDVTLGAPQQGYADTVEEFFERYVKPKMPSADVVKKWHKLLMTYTDEDNLNSLSCCVRFGHSASETNPSPSGELGYYQLRRGWLTKNKDDDFEYFFADNFFSRFIYKMALDGFCPSLDEFADAFKKHRFPYGFGLIDYKINESKGVVIAKAKEPGFAKKYKLSHVFDSGDNFEVNGVIYKGVTHADKELSKKYYDIGHSNDFLNQPDKIRRMVIGIEAKRVIVAKFLRFAHPMNYFLTPLPRLHYCDVKVFKNDIGEDERLIGYVREYLQKTYPTEYAEFLSRIMWYQNPNEPKPDGRIKLGVHYGVPNPNYKSNGGGAQKQSSPKGSSSGVGQYCKQVFIDLLADGKLTGSLLDQLRSKDYCSKNLGISYAVIVDMQGDAFDRRRYYKDAANGKYLICHEWRKKHKDKVDAWLKANGF